ncbi:hypothetical protein M9458_056657 [Cirrhinus mrigala]|uniref:Uncharacterized protein n=1 Tax=Cirrhinus mrigala TaxID=683832 RepID=A0ABD0MGE1_CIRMR
MREWRVGGVWVKPDVEPEASQDKGQTVEAAEDNGGTGRKKGPDGPKGWRDKVKLEEWNPMVKAVNNRSSPGEPVGRQATVKMSQWVLLNSYLCKLISFLHVLAPPLQDAREVHKEKTRRLRN